ncbi:MAG: hypothetical protein KKH68_03740 [Proteobacteria bacterium]|nr:hypothetical protein [Pseudomonadota bacterium]
MKDKRNITWLFAFTDLAFLLLISLSLIPSAPGNIFIHFSEMNIPDVPSNQNMLPVEASRTAWELQIHPQSKDHSTPFKLLKVGMDQGNAKGLYSKYVDRSNLLGELEALRKLNIRPMLMPEKTSLSQDFLFAAGAMASVWASGNARAVVRPINPEELSRIYH